jgi:hypothetical protein
MSRGSSEARKRSPRGIQRRGPNRADSLDGVVGVPGPGRRLRSVGSLLQSPDGEGTGGPAGGQPKDHLWLRRPEPYPALQNRRKRAIPSAGHRRVAALPCGVIGSHLRSVPGAPRNRSITLNFANLPLGTLERCSWFDKKFGDALQETHALQTPSPFRKHRPPN